MMKITPILSIIMASMPLTIPSCHARKEQAHEEPHKVVVTTPKSQDVTITQKYVCQIHSQKHIDIRALAKGYLEEILVKEGQPVKKGDLIFKILPILYQTKFDAEKAEAKLAQLRLSQTQKLYTDKVVSQQDVMLHEAELAKAEAKANMAGAELNFTFIRAPYDGIIDRLREMQGSLVDEGDILTTLSDNSVMWVYFNVPERDYLGYKNDKDEHKAERKIELVLADGMTFNQPGKIGAIEAKFNNETGNIPFRADFQNPAGPDGDRLLRHGQTGTIVIHRIFHNALVIPQRATYEILDKRYVFVVDKDKVVHQREITIQNEQDDIFVIAKGIDANDQIIYEGIRQVRDGEKIEFELLDPSKILDHQKRAAE